MNPLDKVIEILKKEGLNDEQIAKFIENLNNAIAQKVHMELISALTEEDLAEVEKAKDDEVDLTINQLYKERTGQEASDIGDRALEDFIETFLADYERKKAN